MRPRAIAPLVFLMLGAGAGPLLAQTPATGLERGNAHVRGWVQDRVTGNPVPGAVVHIHRADGDGSKFDFTDEDGAFGFAAIPVGSYELAIEALGYKTLTLDVDPDGDTPLDVRARLAPSGVELDPIVATSARQGRLHTVGFHQRERGGIGRFYTRDQILGMGLMELSDLFRRIPGFRVVTGRFGPGGDVLGRGNCRPALYIDGVRTQTSAGMDDILRPEHLAGLEVYSGAQSPGEFQGGRCGTIVAWTHVPDRGIGHPSLRQIGVAAGFVAAILLFAF